MGKQIAGPGLLLPELAAPATPASGFAMPYVKSDGRVYAKNDAGEELSLGNLLKTKSPSLGANKGASWPGGWIESATTGALLVADRIYYVPVYLLFPRTLEELWVHVTTATAAGTGVRLGLYKADEEWQPITRLYGSSAVLTDSTGKKSVTGIGVACSPGPHLLALHAEAAGSCQLWNGGCFAHAALAQAAGSSLVRTMRKNTAYGALADPGVAWDNHDTSSGSFQSPVIGRWE